MPNKNCNNQNQNAWSEFSKKVNGVGGRGRINSYGCISYTVDQWELVLDAYALFRTVFNESHLLFDDCTRMQVYIDNRDAFTCEIYNSTFVSSIGKLLGMQDIKIGDSSFDKKFIIKSNDKSKAIRLLHNNELRTLMSSLPNFQIRINSKNRKMFSLHPEAYDEIVLEIDHYVTEFDVLYTMHKIIVTLLRCLYR